MEAVEANTNAATKPDDIQDIMSSFVFHNSYYLTSVRDEKEFDAAGIHPTVQTWLKFGRPNLEGLFEETRNLCKKENITRVAVCVCGPLSLVSDAKNLCNSSILKPAPSTVRFDCHSEIFDF